MSVLVSSMDESMSWKVLLVLSITKLFEATSNNLGFGYAPQVIHFFGTTWQNVGIYQGIVFGVQNASVACASIFYGWLFDTLERKYVFIWTTLALAVAMFLTAFSTNVSFLIATYCLTGLTTATNIGVRALLVDMVHSKEAMIYALTYTQAAPFTGGLIIGPWLGGVLALPTVQYSDALGKSDFLQRFPILIPHLIMAALLCSAAFASWIVLPEKLSTSDTQNFASNKESTTRYNLAGDVEDSDEPDAEFTTVTEKDPHISHKSIVTEPEEETTYISLLRNTSFFIAGLSNVSFSIFSKAFHGVMTLWLGTPSDMGGLGFPPRVQGEMHIIPGGVSFAFELILLGRINAFLRPKLAFVFWIFISSFIMGNIVNVKIFGTGLVAFVWCTALIGVNNIAWSGCKVSLVQFTNDSVHKSMVGMANAVTQFVGFFSAAIILIVLGSIYAWSLSNEHEKGDARLGFPFNHYFTFYIITFLSLFSAFLSTLLPND